LTDAVENSPVSGGRKGARQTSDGVTGERQRSMPSVKRVLRALAVQLLIALATIGVLDAILFFATPDDIAMRFPGYRQGFIMGDVIGRGYPRGYFEANAERGFDIKPTAVPRTDLVHYTDELSYNIWSNSIGCFDTPVGPLPETYWYLAGDSVAWGHAKYEDLMGTMIQKIKGVEILQCGVTHTGQRHQFSKFLDIGKTLGRWPARVFVVYSPTDTVNDYMHPHGSVVDDGLADTKMLTRDNEIVELDQGWFDQARAEREAAKPSATTGAPQNFSLSRFLLEYSMTSQILNAGLHALNDRAPWLGRHIGVLGEEPMLDWFDRYSVYKGQKLYDLHRLTYLQTQDGHLNYENFKYADANKAVIKQWRDHALANGYSLEFVLPHPGPPSLYDPADATNFYKETMAYLSSLGIKYYDVTAELNKRGVETDDLYWELDAHMSGYGNQVVGRILAEVF